MARWIGAEGAANSTGEPVGAGNSAVASDQGNAPDQKAAGVEIQSDSAGLERCGSAPRPRRWLAGGVALQMVY